MTEKSTPVAFDPNGYAGKRLKADPKFAKAYDDLEGKYGCACWWRISAVATLAKPERFWPACGKGAMLKTI